MAGPAAITWRLIGSIAIRAGCHSNIFYGNIQVTGRGATSNRDYYAMVLLVGGAII